MQTIRRSHRKRASRNEIVEEARELPFLPWVERGRFKADREPINFRKWRALREVYASVPADLREDPEEKLGYENVLMAPSQTGKSVFMLLFTLWFSLRVIRARLGYYLPTITKSLDFSQNRWIRFARENPRIHALMGDPDDPREHHVVHEGGQGVRQILHALIYFFTMGGSVSTESNPLDALVFDEVQEMVVADIQKTLERVSASGFKTILWGSTANFVGDDIDYFYQRSRMRKFHTNCRCPDGIILAEAWDPRTGPSCIGHGNGTTPGVPKGPFYRCPKCDDVIADPQDGQFRAWSPDVRRDGWHYSQMLSPMQSATSIWRKWTERRSTKVFYNRILALPFTDPDSVPITDAVMERAQRPSLRWGPPTRQEVEAVFMGIDQKLHDHHVVIKGAKGGELFTVHLEIVQSPNPWARARELLREYHVKHCVLEALPNLDPAYALAREFPNRVFVVDKYSDDMGGMPIRWMDRDKETRSERKTADAFKTPFTVRVDQYQMMALALGNFVRGVCLTPDAQGLFQRVLTDQGEQQLAICRDRFWEHLKHIALVTELPAGREDERKPRRAVKKLGTDDPHFAFANMLCDVGVARAYGTEFMVGETTLPLEPEEDPMADQKRQDPYGAQVRQHGPDVYRDDATERLTCGDCAYFQDGFCEARQFQTGKAAPQCDDFCATEEEDPEWN